jgi:predicted dehydrogenase
MTTNMMRAGVIGVGVGWNHIEGFQTHPDSDCVAICDANPATLKERGDRFAIVPENRHVDYKALLARSDIDAVSVALPNWLHEPVVMAALEAGKHVLCEKPLATDPAAAIRMRDAAKAAGKLLMVCYNHRFRPEIDWLKKQVQGGGFGKVYAARAGWMREGFIPAHGAWFTQKDKAGGGALIDLGVHVLDLALWLMGYPKPVSVSGAVFDAFLSRGQKMVPRDAKLPHRPDVEDHGMGFVRFDTGAVLNLEVSWAAHREPTQDDYYVRLFGSDAGANFFIRKYNEHALGMYKLVDGEPVSVTPSLSARGLRGHKAAVAHFVDCIVHGAECKAPADHGVTGVQIIDALYRSAREGREVTI